MEKLLQRLATRMATHPPRVVVVGDVMIDRYLWGKCDRISPEAPVQVVAVDDESRCLGGAGNVAANLVGLGAQVSLVSVTGADDERGLLIGMLDDLGVDTVGLLAEEGRPTTVKCRIVASHHQVVRYDVETTRPIGETTQARLAERLSSIVDRADAVVLSDYGKGLLTPSFTRTVIDACRSSGVPVLCDPKGMDWSKYRGATAVTPNKKEASQVASTAITDDASLEGVGKELRSTYELEHLLITLSEEGMALFSEDGCHRIPTVAREVFDVTGAGDTVIAALAMGLGGGLAPFDACLFANAAAGVAVSKVGTAVVTLEQIARATSRSTTGSGAKVVSRDEIAEIAEQLRRKGKRIVFTNGCFDILHVGHVAVLEQAAAHGDVLVVGLNTDASVGRLKPGRPFNHQDDRAQVLAALGAVDHVVSFDEDTPLELIRAIQPDVLVKGGDYAVRDIVGGDVVEARGGLVLTVPLVEGRSTTSLVERVREERAS